MIMVTPKKMSSTGSRDRNPTYWREYSNLQKVKHEVIRHYLNGWFPKLALGPHGSPRLLYLDTHAGRGTHMSGQLGSPLVALETLLAHEAQAAILAKSEVQFYFIERDKENAEALREELKNRTLPKNVVVAPPVNADCFSVLEQVLGNAKKAGKRLPPSFVFCDPYGFTVPGRILHDLMEFPQVELFINVIWRELDMAMQQIRKGDQSQAPIIDSLFAGRDWKTAICSDDPDVRAEECAALLRVMTGARWGTSVTMLGDNGKTRYFLLHLTGNDNGRDLMKECVWKACPEDGYYARKSDHPGQNFLIKPEPDLAPLRAWVLAQLEAGPQHWQTLIDRVRSEIWRKTQLNDVVGTLRKEGKIEGEKGKKFFPANNPRLSLAAPTLF
jgi:three-Cys-motif partner protein